MTATVPLPRPELDRLPLYRPGRPARAVPGLAAFKLSSNENPFGPLPEVRAAAIEALELNRYPEPTAAPLRAALAEHLGVAPEQLAAGAGSLDVLNSILDAYAGSHPDGSVDEVIYAWRSFESYPISVGVAGARAVPIPLLPDGRHDLAAFLAAITDATRVIILCTPNNPTGPALPGADVAEFLARVPPRILVILDEAYTEFVRGADVLDGIALLGGHPNLLVLRTFSKAHGLANLRVGYCVGHAQVIAAVARGAVPFTVSGPGQAAAIASLNRLPAVLQRVDEIVAERDRVADALRADGWQVPDAQGNFVWLPLGARAEQFVAAAGEQALAVRGFADTGVRVSIGTRAANDRLLTLCSRWRADAAVSARAHR